ncbi:SpaA isopeptide-forming pilin-related protein [Clostridium sp. AM58-1XD]|uniref:SpaA isopeptide-forming pilin-related protein n=1 Tax=Clostridium sp. AM58-1XD TaxID=2292307 RepID=UPI000E52A1C1|nr:SpaA isopeptide-forming pilin-related protein [Clostridium sp. AM58-1XD]RGZ01538.1 hypothetical protein DXA13_01495 [Clostridium sp. AM58-1XD]
MWKIHIPDYTNEKVESFEVIYEDKNLSEKSGGKYKLGRDFTPGTLKADFIIWKQERLDSNGNEAKQITQVKNTAFAEMTYDKYDSRGELTAGTKDVTSLAAVDVKEPPVPTVALTKDVAKQKAAGDITVKVDDALTYTLNLENVSTDIEVPMVNPVFFDKLPYGMELQGAGIDKQFAISAPDGVKLDKDNAITSVIDGNTYIYLPFKGDFKKGEKITISYSVDIKAGIISNPEDIPNYVYVTSPKKMEPFTGNAGGASFKAAGSSAWPGTKPELDSAIANFDHELLGNGWISAYKNVGYRSGAAIDVLKEEMGDMDSAFVSGTTSAKASIDDGWVRYRLTVVNSDQTNTVNNLRILDILPAVGDTDLGSTNQRYSKWQVEAPDLEEAGTDDFIVTKYDKNGKGEDIRSDVNVYYSKKNSFSDKADRSKFLNNDIPDSADWSDGYLPSRAAALMFDMDQNIMLEPGERIVIEFLTNVQEFKTQAEKEEAVFTYAVNNFSLRYKIKGSNGSGDVLQDIVPSNKVNALLSPSRVKVGGKIWIDANNNGIQDENDTYLEEKVQELWNNGYFGIKLYKSGEEAGIVDGTLNGDNTFLFDHLIPSRPKTADQKGLYTKGSEAVKNILNPDKLRGDNPENFIIRITTQEENGLGIIWRIAHTTTQLDNGKMTANQDSGKSRVPDDTDLYGENSRESVDNNFYTTSDSEGHRTVASEKFFLWKAGNDREGNEWYDHTKDLGIVPYRNIKVKKTDEDGRGLQGTKFSIYGPFATPLEASEDPEKLVYPLTKDRDAGRTNENGELENLPELLYYQNYLLVEEEASAGFVVSGAEADLETASVGEGKSGWIIPNMAAVDSSQLSSANDIHVKDPYDTGMLRYRKIDKSSNENLEGAGFELIWTYDGVQANKGMTEESARAAWEEYRSRFAVEADLSKGIRNKNVPADHENKIAFETDGTGEIALNGLPYGSYLLKETLPPEGYSDMIDKCQKEFIIDRDHKSVPDVKEELVFTNERLPFNLKWQKKNIYGSFADGIQFKVEGPGVYKEGMIFKSFHENETLPEGCLRQKTAALRSTDFFMETIRSPRWLPLCMRRSSRFMSGSVKTEPFPSLRMQAERQN